MAKILIVDDDVHINDMLSEALGAQGYEVVKAFSGSEALMVLEKIKPDLVLLDLMIPGLSGEELLPKIKDVPVIVVSAKADINDKVGLLLNGAADYITKPFNMQELLARITVQLRNAKKTAYASDQNVLTFESLTLNLDTHILYTENSNVSHESVGVPMAESSEEFGVSDFENNLCKKKEIKITRTEFAILKLLMRNPEQVISKLTILEKISLDTPDCTEDSLKIHIHNLRKKLKEATRKEWIKAIWGIGFMITSKS
ncbi:MAG: response regulator transcription factor [Lachnospiraceae bacterium]|nr:response regulator transcription factor [Lachnospiraceae bacterium]